MPLPETTESTRQGLTVKVVCPVCMTGIQYDHKEPFAWGMASLTDFAEVNVTAHDGGKIRDHMMSHIDDGTWIAAVRKLAAELTARADQFGK